MRSSWSVCATPLPIHSPPTESMPDLITPPASEQELIQRAIRLTGMSLAQIAREIGVAVPMSQREAKGWIGVLMEARLGASAGSLSEPDFQAIGVEMKTLPLNHLGKPRESTYVCTVPLIGNTNLDWLKSNVRRKLNRVLWVPVEADPSLPLASRRVGSPFLWSPGPEQEAVLREDWEELMERISLGELDRLTARQGRYLQIRPKGANAASLTRSITETGESGLTLPRGFYLRASFTHTLLSNAVSSA